MGLHTEAILKSDSHLVREQELPPLHAVVLNTNRRVDTMACLESLAASTYPNLSVTVLDNHSTDGSVEAIGDRYPRVELVSLAENRGYAGNNNVGIQRAMERGAEWVLVLNEDTILEPECLTKLISAASEPSVGIVGPMVYHFDEPSIIQSAGGKLDDHLRSSHVGQNEPDHGQFNSCRDVDWISGCAICVRAEVIRQIGMLDERFFYYWEETEWCIRARRAGWRIVFEPRARLWHKGVQRDYKPSPDVAYYNTRNRLMTLSKHHAPVAAWAVAYAEIFRTVTSMSLRSKWKSNRAHRDALWDGLVDFHLRRWGRRPSNAPKATA